jgi:hypothetical protein
MKLMKWCCRNRFRCYVPDLGAGYGPDPSVITEPLPSANPIIPIEDTQTGLYGDDEVDEEDDGSLYEEGEDDEEEEEEGEVDEDEEEGEEEGEIDEEEGDEEES